MHSVVEVNQFEDLARYRSAWNGLWLQTRNASFFQSFDWFETYWQHFGEGQRLRALVVGQGCDLIGILPLVVRRERMGIGRLRVLTYPVDDWATFFGPIGPNATATLLAGMRHVRQTARDWDLLDLRWVDEAGCDHGRTPQAMTLAGFAPQKETWGHAPVVEIAGSWDAYWGGRAKKWRHNVSRLQRRLDELGSVRYVRHRPEGLEHGDSDPRWDLYDACVHLAERSWQGSSTTGTTLSHAKVRQFLRDVHEVAARLGCLDLNLLLVDDRPAAFAYNYRHRGLISGLRMGYEPDLSAGGPGSVLQRLILEDTFRRGDTLYDFGPGYLDCKRPWQTCTATSVHYTHYPLSVPRVQLLRLKRWLRRHFQPDYVAYDRCA